MTKPTTLFTTIGIAAAATAPAALAGATGRPPLKFDPEVGMPVPDLSRMLSGHPEGAPDPAGAPAGHAISAR